MRVTLAVTLLAGLAASSNLSKRASSGCGTTPTLTSGTYTIPVNNQNREYILTIPDTYSPNTTYKLIFGLHWLGGTMTDVSSGAYYGVQPLTSDSAIFIAPQGLDNGWANPNNDDVTLIDTLISSISSTLCIDENHIYSMGWSYGGSMSYTLACARPEVFRAVAVLSGANLSGPCEGTEAVAYYGQHGTHDSVLDISLGKAIRDTFVGNNGCTVQETGEPALGSGMHVKSEYQGCREGYPVTWIAFDGDHVPDPVDAGGSVSWTGGEVWGFFEQFD